MLTAVSSTRTRLGTGDAASHRAERRKVQQGVIAFRTRIPMPRRRREKPHAESVLCGCEPAHLFDVFTLSHEDLSRRYRLRLSISEWQNDPLRAQLGPSTGPSLRRRHTAPVKPASILGEKPRPALLLSEAVAPTTSWVRASTSLTSPPGPGAMTAATDAFFPTAGRGHPPSGDSRIPPGATSGT